MSERNFLTTQCRLIRETEKAVHLHWCDPENEMDMQIWVPKACIEEDDFDREATLQKLRRAPEPVLVDLAIWWLRDQEWFDDSIQELIDL